MKNLLIYISPKKKFSKECSTLVKVQIDNSFNLGWNKEDIILVTNFEYEYNGIKSIVVGDEHYCDCRPRSINTIIIPYLIDIGVIDKENIYWVHDFDAYQLNIIKEEELGLDNVDMGLTDYGWRKKWCMGSLFVKASSKDIFQLMKDIVIKNVEDEDAMVKLTQRPDISKRYKKLNITYNFGMRHVESNWEIAIKPLRIVHFHPVYKLVPTLDIFMYGKSGLNMPLINERFTKILNYHNIK